MQTAPRSAASRGRAAIAPSGAGRSSVALTTPPRDGDQRSRVRSRTKPSDSYSPSAPSFRPFTARLTFRETGLAHVGHTRPAAAGARARGPAGPGRTPRSRSRRWSRRPGRRPGGRRQAQADRLARRRVLEEDRVLVEDVRVVERGPDHLLLHDHRGRMVGERRVDERRQRRDVARPVERSGNDVVRKDRGRDRPVRRQLQVPDRRVEGEARRPEEGLTGRARPGRCP